MRRVLWVRPLLALTVCLACCFLHVSCAATPFPQDLEPISIVGSEYSQQCPSFEGLRVDSATQRLGLDFQRMLRINHMLYIAARDHVFAVNLSASAEQIIPQQSLTWKTKDVEKCTVRGKNSDECYNYIKVLVRRDDETVFACGTNAFNPACRNYKMSTLEQVGEEVVGQARCPFESRQSNVGLFAGGDFYSATMTDFLASDAVIYRSLGEESTVLRTVKYDSKWLREPNFLHAIEYGNYVYFFFSEIAVEHTSLGKVVFSRVARVCKSDSGGSPRVLERYWTSFLKARLNCSVPGDSFFYFDVLQSVSDVLQVNQQPAVLAVFTTQTNSITGSAVCAFYLDDIERAFNGRFKEQRTSESAWTPVPDEQVPSPRPGSCAGDGDAALYRSSTTFPDQMLTFIKSYPLMDEAVPSVNNRPCFTRTTSRFKLTQIAVDTSTGPYKNYTVLFLGSENGRVLKVLASTNPNSSHSTKLLEDIDVYNPARCDVHGEDRRILGLELDKEHHALFVAFSSCVIRVPLSRCAAHAHCRGSCLSSRDPYCIWLNSEGCSTFMPGVQEGFEQHIDGDSTQSEDSCSADILVTTRKQVPAVDTAFGKTTPPTVSTTNQGPAQPKTPDDSQKGVRRSPEVQRADHSVHYTLLIACVLVAFVLGAFLSGFLVSCYCSHSVNKTQHLAKAPEGPLPPPLSLRSLAELSGLLEHQAKEEKLEVASPKLYNAFFPNGQDQPSRRGAPPGTLSELLRPNPRLSSEVSGLPTPDSTPELPIKSMRPFKGQWEKNQNCNNATEPKPALLLYGPRAEPGLRHTLLPFPHSLSAGHPLCAALQADERKAQGAERTLGPPSSCYAHNVVDVTCLDDLLRHIHELNVKTPALTAAPPSPPSTQMPFANRVQPQVPETESAPYYSSSTLPRDSLTRRMDVPPDLPPHGHYHQSTLERVSRHPAHRHSLISASIAGGAGLGPRQHSFSSHRGCQNGPPFLLTRMNSAGSGCEVRHPLLAAGGYAMRHSYGEQPDIPRGRAVRRTASLKPDVPPKPLFIPASSPISQPGKFHY